MSKEQIIKCLDVMKELGIEVKLLDVKFDYLESDMETKSRETVYIVTLKYLLQYKSCNSVESIEYRINAVDTYNTIVKGNLIDKNTRDILKSKENIFYKIDDNFYLMKDGAFIKANIFEYELRSIKTIKSEHKCWSFVDILSDYLWFLDYEFNIEEFIIDLYGEDILYKEYKKHYKNLKEYSYKLKNIFRCFDRRILESKLEKLKDIGWE